MRKKIVSVALGISMAATMMSGCAKSAETSATTQAEAKIAAETKKAEESKASGGEKVKLRMTYWNSEDTMQSMLDYLATKVPEVEIEYQFIDNSNYDTIVDTQLSAGEGPDIICESPGSSLKHARLGYLEPMNDLGGRYSAAGTSVYSYDNQVYALPGISWFEGIYYNKDLFEQNNIALP
ncbi:MAG: extracellular solute-binding protein, partial [Hungatella sp.]